MKHHLALLAAFCASMVTSGSYAQSSQAQIRSLLAEVAAAYRDMSAFGATIETTQVSGTTQTKTTTKLKLQRPGKLSAEVVAGSETKRVVADGRTVYSDSSRDKTKYAQEPGSKLEDAITVLSRAGGGGTGVLSILLTSANAENQIVPAKPTSLIRLADETVDGEVCDVIASVTGVGARAIRNVFAFGKKDHLLRRLTIGATSAGARPAAVESYSNVTLQPALTAASFKFTTVPGAVAIVPPKEKEPEMYDPRLKVGAAPLPIIGRDLSGTPFMLGQYKGKVLLIDFWATWCGPCVAEMPNVVAAYNKYHGEGFEVLGISLDDANARQELDAFLQENRMPWRQIYDGKHWQANNAVAWDVHAIPFTVLIGRDGKIAAVGARGNALAPAIEAALKKQ